MQAEQNSPTSILELLHLLGQGGLGEVDVYLGGAVIRVAEYALHHIPDNPGLNHLGGGGVA